MKSLILILALCSVAYSVPTTAMKDHKDVPATTEHAPLHYYNKYELNHGTLINPKIPLTKHYSNEREERKADYKLKDEIRKLKEETHFKLLDMERHILELQNKFDDLKNEVNGNVREDDQKTMAIEEQINHDEKFKEMYNQRLEENSHKEKTALPDQVPVYKKLMKFDENREEHWLHDEKHQQKDLDHLKEKTVLKNAEDRQKMANKEEKINRIKSQEKALARNEGFKKQELSDKQKDARARLHAMKDLDLERKVESSASNKDVIKA